jgi:3-oxoacyl-[acyl-carrier protein] reductase
MTDAMPEKARGSIMDKIPLKRGGAVDDIAGGVSFLAGEDASYITGQVISVNGGMY